MLVGEPPFPGTIAQLMRAVLLGAFDVIDELRAQVRRILDAGLEPTHLDTHKHTHLLPPVLDAVARLSEEFKFPGCAAPSISRSRRPGRVSGGQARHQPGFGIVRSRFARVLAGHGCRSTDHFAGFQITGRYNAAELAQLIRALPEGSTEFMCHPGICGDELRGARTRLKESREAANCAL